MKHFQLKNKASKTKGPKDILKYKEKSNCVVILNNQSKQDYFDSLNSFLDSHHFWKSCKSYFSNKFSFGDSKLAFNKNGKTLTENIKIFIRTLYQSRILLNYSTGPFSQISPMTKCKISLIVFPIILVLLTSSANSQYFIMSFYSKNIPTFNHSVIKNTPVTKIRPFFVFIEGFHLSYGHASCLIRRRQNLLILRLLIFSFYRFKV